MTIILLWFAMLRYQPVGPQPSHTVQRHINVRPVGPASNGMHRY
jgi:hypothetical protein